MVGLSWALLHIGLALFFDPHQLSLSGTSECHPHSCNLS